MKRFSLTLGLLLTAIWPALPGQAARPADPKTPGPASLKFETLTIDFGRIGDEATVRKKVAFRNEGDQSVTIRNVKVSCGCVLPSKLEKTSYDPGEEGELDIGFSPALRQGTQRKPVVVESDDPRAPRQELVVLAEVIPRLGIEPRNHFFGQFDRGQKGPVRSLILTLREPGLVLESVEMDDPRFSLVKTSEEEVEEEGRQIRKVTYEVQFLGDDAVGRVQAAVKIKSNLKGAPNMHVTLLADVVGELKLIPDRLSLRFEAAGKPFSQDITVYHRFSRDFRIFEMSVDAPESMKLSVVNKGPDPRFKSSYILSLEGISPVADRPGQGMSIFSGAVTFTTDLVEQPTVTIPMKIFLVLPPPKPPPGE